MHPLYFEKESHAKQYIEKNHTRYQPPILNQNHRKNKSAHELPLNIPQYSCT